jgi:predicted amidohydrolase YtcJ
MRGFQDGLWPDTPHYSLFDAVAPSVPVYAISHDLHCAWLNSAALKATGLENHPTGLLREEECFPVAWALSNVADETVDGWVAEAAAKAAARGVVGVVDLDLTVESQANWIRRDAAGFDALRVEAGVFKDYLDQAIAQGLRTGQPLGVQGLLTVGPLKVVSDGSLNTRTALCCEPYPGLTGEGSCGLHTVPYDELLEIMSRGWAAGLVPAIHAIGDEANTLALDAFEKIGCPGKIEHAQLLRWEDVPRFAQLGVIASVQPEHAMDDRDVADRHWAGRTNRSFMLRSLLDAGAVLALGSDAPVAPLDPWITIAAGVTRARDGREPWHPEQALTIAEALKWSARGRTTLEAGQPADLQVVDQDPTAIDPAALRTMPVSATLIAARFTHNAL